VLFCRAVTPLISPAIEVEDLIKTYGEVEAVRGVSFTVPPGEVFGFLGPNGAGKSTTINMLCTLVTPTSGTARVSGFDVVSRRDDVRRHIGLVFQDPTLDLHLTAEQNLRLHAELYDIDAGVIPARVDQMLQMVGLADRRDQPVMTFSGGMKRRLEIARGLMHSPRVLFLDEPTIGLDPQTRSSIWRYIRALQEAEGTTIFMTTHYMDEAEFCHRIAIMDRGEIVVLDTPEALKAGVGADRVVLGTADDDAALSALRDRFGIEASVAEGAVTFHVSSGEAFLPRLFAEWDPAHPAISSVAVSRPTLDDVFMRYTGTTIRDAETGGLADLHRTMMRAMAGAKR
jgi:ABC-2 type transport system ATP-binding protein